MKRVYWEDLTPEEQFPRLGPLPEGAKVYMWKTDEDGRRFVEVEDDDAV